MIAIIVNFYGESWEVDERFQLSNLGLFVECQRIIVVIVSNLKFLSVETNKFLWMMKVDSELNGNREQKGQLERFNGVACVT